MAWSARQLGRQLRRTTLIEKMKKLMIEKPSQAEAPGDAAE